MLRITRGCKATETLPVTPEAMTLGLAADTKEKNTHTALWDDDCGFPTVGFEMFLFSTKQTY